MMIIVLLERSSIAPATSAWRFCFWGDGGVVVRLEFRGLMDGGGEVVAMVGGGGGGGDCGRVRCESGREIEVPG